MGAQGTASLDFGAFPGDSDASVVITGQGSILTGSLVEAWILPVNTADHTHDEHLIETIRIVAGSIVAGVGFTIYGFNTNQIIEPLQTPNELKTRIANAALTQSFKGSPSIGGMGTLLWGVYNVAWVWN